ncbi:hypothetical protein [Nitrosophilus labii]|uniref:hypothetical protein n=1 Tax=Nitrosophilus labii TaxID=2706014 RepID=UPI0016575E25|nr:hypothetical protein [Nitrosophilus labii]
MKIEEMKMLQPGHFVVDLETTKKWKRIVICEVIKKDDSGIVIYALKEEDERGYPHRFRFNENDASMLLSLSNVNRLYDKLGFKFDANKIAERYKERFKDL